MKILIFKGHDTKEKAEIIKKNFNNVRRKYF